MALLLDRCCCCCSLRRGTILIGAFYLTTYTILGILTGMVIAYVSVNGVEDELCEKLFQKCPEEEKDQLVRDAMIQWTVLVILSTIEAVLNILLLVGVKKENTLLLLIYIVYSVLMIVISFAWLVWSFAVSTAKVAEQTVLFVETLLGMYFLAVVICYRRQIQIEKSGGYSAAAVVYEVEKP